VSTFTFMPGIDIRAILRNGDPWFVAKDICDAIGTDTKDIRATLDSDEVIEFTIPGQRGRSSLLISESGLFALVLKSRKAEAKPFRRWVTGTVLPDIRKFGAHVVGAEALPAHQREAFYGLVHKQLAEALRRIDRDTEYDHFCSTGKRQKRLQGAVTKVAQDMGLPMHVVAALVDGGVDKGLKVMVST
jgi:prophage antirepressor-like protein